MELVRDRRIIATVRMRRRAFRKLVNHFARLYGSQIFEESPGTLQIKAKGLIPHIKKAQAENVVECTALINLCMDYREMAELLAMFRYVGSTKVIVA